MPNNLNVMDKAWLVAKWFKQYFSSLDHEDNNDVVIAGLFAIVVVEDMELEKMDVKVGVSSW